MPLVCMLKDRKNDVIITKCGKELSYRKQGDRTAAYDSLITCPDCIRGKVSS